MNKNSVEVWWYYDTPEELRQFSNHGGDEDYVILATYDNESMGEMIAEKLAICDYNRAETDYKGEKMIVFITAHS